MPGEPIGSIGVEITGDYSDLSDALSQSVIAAELTESKIAGAFNGAAGSVDEWSQALSKSTNATQADVEAIGKAADKYAQFGTAVDNALGPERDQLDVLQQMPKSYTEMTAAQQRAVDSLNQQVTASREAGGALGELTGGTFGWSDALKLVGVTLSAVAVKEFVTDALEAYAAVERATVAITALSGSAETAHTAIAALKDLAVQDALSFPALLTAEQRLLAFGISAQQIPHILQTIADTAAATNRDFNSVANTFERIIESGQVQGRTLTQLGINMKDLAGAMGVTEGEAKKMLAAMDISDRTAAMGVALDRFKGLSGETAKTIGGQWQSLSNEFQFAMQDMGKALEPFASTVVSVMHGVALPAFRGVVEEVTRVSDALKGLGGILKDASDPLVKLTNDVFGLHNTIGSLVKGPLHDWIMAPINAPIYLIEGLIAAYNKYFHTQTTQQPLLIEGWKLFGSTVDSTTADMITKQEDLNMKAINLHDSLQKLTQMAKDGAVGWDVVALATKEYKKALDEAEGIQGKHILSLVDLKLRTAEGAAEVSKAMLVVQQANDLDDTTANKKVLVAEAIKQLQQASKKYADQVTDANLLATIDIATTQQQVDQAEALRAALSRVADQTGSFSLATNEARAALEKYLASHGLLLSDLDRLRAHLIAVDPLFKALGVTSSEALQKTADKMHDAAGLVGAFADKVSGDGVRAWGAWTDAAKKAADASSVVQSAAHQMGITTVTDLTAQRDKYLKLIDDMRRSGESGWDAIRAAMQKVKDIQDEINAAMDPLTQAYKTLGIESAKQLQIDIDRKRAALDLISGTVDYQRGLEAVEKAQQKLNDALGITDKDLMYIGQTDQHIGRLPGAATTAETAIEKMNAALEETKHKLSDIQQGIVDMAKHWSDFQNNLSVKPPGGTFGPSGSTSSDFNSGFSIPAHTHIDYSLWGISGARVVPDRGWHYDTFGNLVEDDWHILATGGSLPGAGSVPTSAAPIVGSTAAPGVTAPIAAQVAPQIQALLDMGYTLDQIVTSTATLNTTMDNAAAKISGSFTALSPVIQQATTQIAASVQQQAASFTRLTDALAPINAPLPTTTGTPAAFQRLGDARVIGGSNSNSTTVNNMSINLAPDEESLLNQLVTLLQRRGIRM